MANNWLLVSFVHCMLNRQNWVTFTESYMHAIQKLFEVGYLIWLFESFWMVKVFAWLQRSLSGQIKLMYLCHNTVGLKPLGGDIKEEDQGSSKTTEMSFHEIKIGATNADCSNNICYTEFCVFYGCFAHYPNTYIIELHNSFHHRCGNACSNF